MSKIGDDIRKVEAWFKKVFTTIETDAEKVAVFITSKLDAEIESLIKNGELIAIEKVVDIVTKSNIGDTIGAAIVKEWPKIVEVAQDVQKVIGGLPVIKTMIAAQIAGILNSFKENPEAPRIQLWIAGVEAVYQDLKKDIQQVIE